MITYTTGTAFSDTDGISDGQNLLKIAYTNTINSFADVQDDYEAATITLDNALANTDGLATVFYDADAGNLVYGLIKQGGGDGAVLGTTADASSFNEIGTASMSITDYNNFGAANVTFVA